AGVSAGLFFEVLLFFHDRLCLSGSGRLGRTSGLLGGARGGLGDPRGPGDAECLGRRVASRLFRREARVFGASRLDSAALVFLLALDGAALLFLLTQRGQSFVCVAALLVAALFLFT